MHVNDGLAVAGVTGRLSDATPVALSPAVSSTGLAAALAA